MSLDEVLGESGKGRGSEAGTLEEVFGWRRFLEGSARGSKAIQSRGF